jgi:hypothetical protein
MSVAFGVATVENRGRRKMRTNGSCPVAEPETLKTL